MSPRLAVAVALASASGMAAGPLGAQSSPLSVRYVLEERADDEDLPGRLSEVSGLAVTADGRVFAHADERAVVEEIDPATGKSVKRFELGRRNLRADFEGIAIVGERFFLLASDGLLFEFREGEDRARVPYRVTDAGVRERCEAEGLAHDPARNELLIACKVSLPEDGTAVVHRLPVEPGVPRPAPVRIRLAELAAFGLPAELHPSGIEVDPATGTWVLIAAREETIVEVSPEGRILDAVRLSRKRHPQPEGVTFGRGGVLLVADEGGKDDGRITTYAPRGGDGGS